MLDLNGKKALVTGSAKRIGRSLALALGKQGCDVLLHYNRSEAAATALLRELSSLGVKAEAVQGDLSEPAAVKRLAEESVRIMGGLDILVNNASTWPSPGSQFAEQSIEQESVEQWDTAIAVNARAPFFLIQHLAAELRKSKGSVVNLLDESISRPFVTRASHSVSKSALASITKLAASSLAPEVRVNGLELGYILPADESDHRELSGAAVAAGVDSVINALFFLLENTYINGQIIPVCGLR